MLVGISLGIMFLKSLKKMLFLIRILRILINVASTQETQMYLPFVVPMNNTPEVIAPTQEQSHEQSIQESIIDPHVQVFHND